MENLLSNGIIVDNRTEGWKEGNVLFNKFYLQLYGVEHMVKNMWGDAYKRTLAANQK